MSRLNPRGRPRNGTATFEARRAVRRRIANLIAAENALAWRLTTEEEVFKYLRMTVPAYMIEWHRGRDARKLVLARMLWALDQDGDSQGPAEPGEAHP
jgi:hypothetical protein